MIKKLRNIDAFSRNIIIVFAGTSLVNFINLLYQLLIAHKLSAVNFAAFNSLLAIFAVISAPLGTIQIAVAKHISELKAKYELKKINFFLSGVLKKLIALALVTFVIFLLAAFNIVKNLEIPSVTSGYILAVLLASGWLLPFFLGGVQGLEYFSWLTAGSIIIAIVKLFLGFTLVTLGYNISGALGALLVSNLLGIAIYYFPLRRFVSVKASSKEDIDTFGGAQTPAFRPGCVERVDYRRLFGYLLPVGASCFCFMSLVNSDMILVKHFFGAEESGFYALAQMVGKIFLFLPLAISTVMFPRTSGLNAVEKETVGTLRKSLLYAFCLCLAAGLFYNFFPSLVLRILTGKAFGESIVLGRLFSISMSFFTLSYVLILYFLSIKDLRFVKYLFCSLLLQIIAVMFFHRALIQVQLILCVNSIALFLLHLFLARRHGLCLSGAALGSSNVK